MAHFEDDIGFDPRRWRATDVAAPSSVDVTEPAGEPRASAEVPRWPWVAGGALLLAAAPLSSYLARDTAGHSPATIPVAPSAPKVAHKPDVAERVSTLPSAAHLGALLVAQGAAQGDAEAIARLVTPQFGDNGPITASVSLRLTGGVPEILRVKASRGDSSGVIVIRDDTATGGWRSSQIARALATQFIVASGQMNDDSLYSSALAAHIDESIIPDFAQAFVYDFNFQLEIHAGDVFEMASEQSVNADGVAVGAPNLVYAFFNTGKKSRALYRFTTPGGKAGWFDYNGASVVRSLMRTPVEGARISSHFGFRVHPVLGFVKMHKGVDFAVPMGTPVFAAGSGVVLNANFTPSGGNMLILKHDKGYETKYLHLQSFAPGVAVGATVTQGQRVALSGNGGELSTGPHLHYELHLNGEPIDPLSVQIEAGVKLEGEQLTLFRRERDRIDAARAAHMN